MRNLYKKVMTLAVVFSAVLLVNTATTQAATVPEGCYTFNSGTGTIEGYDSSGMGCNETNLDIPSTIGGDSVTAIGVGAFSGEGLTAVTIPNSVTSIGSEAFMSNELTAVTIPNSVTSIGDIAFRFNNISSLTLGSSLTSIGGFAFGANSLQTVTIPNSVTSIGGLAFSLQSSLGKDIIDEIMSGDPARAQDALDGIWHTLLYTQNPANPNSLVNDSGTEADLGADVNNDGDETDSLGGHLINPAELTVSFEDGNGATLQADQEWTGQGLLTYMASENVSNDLSLYYRLGTTHTLSAPSISGYVAPAGFDLLFEDLSSSYTFVYQADAGGNAGGGSTTPEGLAATGRNVALLVVVGIVLIGASFAILWRSKAKKA